MIDLNLSAEDHTRNGIITSCCILLYLGFLRMAMCFAFCQEHCSNLIHRLLIFPNIKLASSRISMPCFFRHWRAGQFSILTMVAPYVERIMRHRGSDCQTRSRGHRVIASNGTGSLLVRPIPRKMPSNIKT